MQYPDHHPKAEEIRIKKAEIETLFSAIKLTEDRARGHYLLAMANLKEMGECNKSVHDMFGKMAKELESLKGIIDSPII